MKRKLLTKKNIIQNIKSTAFILFVFINSFQLFSQQVVDSHITVNKTITNNTAGCNLFDVELSITGNAPNRPIEVMLVIDTSGSMGWDIPYDNKNSLDYAKIAANDFIDNIFNATNNPTGLNKVGIVSYGTYGTLQTGLISNVNKLHSKINGLGASGWTNIAQGLDLAKEELKDSGTHDCSTIRSIILLTDGVATAAPGCYSGNNNQCAIDAAIASGQDAQSETINGTVYDTNIFSVGLFGGISGSDQTTAENTLDQIQNSGLFVTENAPDLSGIYNQILGQLSWAAKQISPSDPIAKDILGSGFSLVPGSLNPSKGTASETSPGEIGWFMNFINTETVTLKYTIQANSQSCGLSDTSVSTINYIDFSCNTKLANFNNPDFCVPCPTVTGEITQEDCSNIINYTGSVTNSSCSEIPTYSYLWEFYINGVKDPSLTQTDLSGSITLPSLSANETIKGVLTTTATTSKGCFTFEDKAVSSEITAYSSPDLNITNPTAVCAPSTVDLTAPEITDGSDSGTFKYYTDEELTTLLTNPNAVSESGTYYIELTNTNGCTTSKPVTVVINPQPTATISYLDSPYCAIGTATVTQTGQTGGEYSSTPGLEIDSSTGAINLETSTPGTYTVTYSFSNGTCNNATTSDVTINALPEVSLEAAGPFCVDAAAVQLTASPSGGTFSGTGVSASGMFTPSTAGVGSHDITYTYSDGNSCENSATITIAVNALPETPEITGDSSVCMGSELYLETTATGTTWYSSNTDVATVNANGVVTPVAPGTAIITYMVENSETGCSSISAGKEIKVNALPVGSDKELTIDSGDTLNEILTTNMSNVTYAWQAADNTNIVGETTVMSSSSGITDTLTNLTGSVQDVVYTITPTSEAGCSGDSYTITVHVNPKLPTISIDDQLNIAEGNTANFTVTLSNTYIYDVTFTVNTVDGTAVAPGDYVAIVNQTYTIPAGSTSVNVPVTLNNDNIYEPTELYQVVLSNAKITTIDTPITTTDLVGDGSITNTTEAPVVSIVATTQASEPDSNGLFTINLTNPMSTSTTVSYTVSGTATNGTDYETITNSIVIPANTTSITIPVNVIDDDIVEGTESVILTLLNTDNTSTITTVPADATATVNITDDDSASVSINDAPVVVEGSDVVFTVTLTGNIQDALTVDFSTNDGTAVAPDDYTTQSGVVTFPAGSVSGATQTVIVTTIDNSVIEPTENFTVDLSNLISSGSTSISDNQGIGTIIDLDIALVDDATSTDEDTSVVISVLENDTYGSDDSVQITEVTSPSNGTVVINEDGTVTYIPNPDFNGEDTFDYTVTVTNSDESTTTGTATVTVTVNPVQDVQDDTAETTDQNPIEIDVLANDTFDSNTNLEITSVTTPTNGNVVINSGGTVTYTANEGFYGEDTFEYTVTVTNADGTTTTETATVTVTVTLSPFAIDDEAVTDANIPIDINVLDNDYDEDGNINPESVVITEDPFDGTVVVNADGTVTYTPNTDFIGEDTFVYQVCDNDGLCDTATVTVVVTGVLAAELIIPQGFSPNGDGIHDVFYIHGLVNLYPNFQLQIYNRWGNKVYDYTHNGNPDSEPKWWDGYSQSRTTLNKSRQEPVGTYFYVLHFNKDGAKPRSGYVYLNR